jgi:Protein of unknown function (DUF3102)
MLALGIAFGFSGSAHTGVTMSNVADLKTDPLADLATRIKSLHAQVVDAGKNVVRKAIDAGLALIEAKRQVGHGQWLKWLKENCELSERTAEVYMECARNRQRLEPIIAVAANMTLSQALRQIRPKPDKGNDGAMGKYEKARVALIKKLGALPIEDVEDAAQRTIAELQGLVAAVKPTTAKAA